MARMRRIWYCRVCGKLLERVNDAKTCSIECTIKFREQQFKELGLELPKWWEEWKKSMIAFHQRRKREKETQNQKKVD